MMTTGMHIVSGEHVAAPLSSGLGNTMWTDTPAYQVSLALSDLVTQTFSAYPAAAASAGDMCVTWERVLQAPRLAAGVLPVEAAVALSLSPSANAGLRV